MKEAIGNPHENCSRSCFCLSTCDNADVFKLYVYASLRTVQNMMIHIDNVNMKQNL